MTTKRQALGSSELKYTPSQPKLIASLSGSTKNSARVVPETKLNEPSFNACCKIRSQKILMSSSATIARDSPGWTVLMELLPNKRCEQTEFIS